MFFTQINQMMDQGVDITLVIRKREGLLTVSSMPRANGLKDEAQNHIIPLTLTGTPEELDGAFLQTICQPIQKTSGLLANMSQFEQQADKAAANSKAAKELKEKEAKEAKEKKDKFDKLMKSVGELEVSQKYSEAISTLQYAKTFATDQSLKSVDEKIAAIKGKMSQGSLFDMENNQQPPQSPQGNQPQQPVQPQVVVQQPVHQPIQQQPVQHPIQQQQVQHPPQHSTNGGYPIQNGQPVYGQQQPTHNNAPVNNNNQQVIDYNPAYEHSMPVDYSAHREGEYDQYLDFPGHSNNQMYNQ